MLSSCVLHPAVHLICTCRNMKRAHAHASSIDILSSRNASQGSSAGVEIKGQPADLEKGQSNDNDLLLASLRKLVDSNPISTDEQLQPSEQPDASRWPLETCNA